MFIRGDVSFKLLIPETNTVIDQITFQNTITDAGLEKLASMIIGENTDPIAYIQIGNGGQTEDGQYRTVTPDETDLYTFFAESPVSTTWIPVLNGAKVQFSHTFEVPINVSINEIGLFDKPHDDPTAIMIAKQTFISTVQRIRMMGVIPTNNTIWFKPTWTLTFGRHWEQIGVENPISAT